MTTNNMTPAGDPRMTDNYARGETGADFLRNLLSSIHAHLRHSRDRRHLESLPDYLLDDIGLACDIVRTITR